MTKKTIAVETPIIEAKTAKQELLELYDKLIELRITRIADLENLIAKAE